MQRQPVLKSLVLIFTMVTGIFICRVGATAKAYAQDPYYKGKTIKVMVPVSAGGTYDKMARLVAQFAPRFIPGNPTMIVENRPGGGGLIGERYLYESKPDGMMIGHFASSHVVKQFTGEVKEIDFTKFNWLGSAGGSTYMMYIRSALPYHTVEDLRNAPKPVKLGGLSKGTSISDAALILKEMVGLNLQVVEGYKGYNPLALAIRQGELDGVTTAVALAKVHPITKEMISTNFCRIVLLMEGREPEEEYKDLVKGVPYAAGYIKDPHNLEVYKAYMGLYVAARPFAAPPGTNPKTLEILRTAFGKTMQDENFRDAAQKSGFVLSPADYAETTSIINTFLKMPPQKKQKLLTVWK